jgi:microcystin-dependent protein
MQWWSDTLPSGFAVTWAWMNGQSLAVATYPALAAVYPGLISAGNIILPDMRENVPLGKSTMGGAANPGRIPQYNTTALLTQAGEGKHTLLLAELATHNHNGATGNQSADHTHTFSDYYYTTTGNAPTTVQSGVGAAPLFSVTDAQGFLANTTNVNGTNHTHTIPNAGTATPFNVVQPSLVCNWVMRVA